MPFPGAAAKRRALLSALSAVCGGAVEVLPSHTSLAPGDVPVIEQGVMRAVLRPPAPSDSGMPKCDLLSFQRDGLRAAAAVLGCLLDPPEELPPGRVLNDRWGGPPPGVPKLGVQPKDPAAPQSINVVGQKMDLPRSATASSTQLQVVVPPVSSAGEGR